MSALKTAYYGAGSAWAAATGRRPFGRSIYDAATDWDICLVLDSLRADTAADLAPAAFDRGRAWSRGSVTTEWLAQTFRADEPAVAETTLLSANPHTKTVFEDREWLTSPGDAPVPYPSVPAARPEAFAGYRELWRTHATEHGAVPPETMAAATVEAWRDGAERVVAHWLQPHEPFIADAAAIVGGAATETNVWAAAKAGDIDGTAVRESYRATAERAFAAVDDVLESVDATVLLTADHGNFFGELGQWGHPFWMLHPAVRQVPWLLAEAERETDWSPRVDEVEAATDSREKQLEALGYV